MSKPLPVVFLIVLCIAAPLQASCFCDFDNSGMVSIVDALIVARYDVETNVLIDLEDADVNLSETVDIVDALLIARYYVKLITEFNRIDDTPCNPEASAAAILVPAYLAKHSSPGFNGVISG